MCLRTSDKMKISHKLAIPPPPPPHRNFRHYFGPVNFIFGPVNFIFGPVNFIFGPVNFIFGPVNFIFRPVNFIFGPAAEIQFPKCGGGGGGAKLHEFPTLHRFARFTIAYCFTKTTLGHI